MKPTSPNPPPYATPSVPRPAWWWRGLAAVWLFSLVVVMAGLLPRAMGIGPGVEAPQVSSPLPCLSYAPFRRSGHTPMNPTLRMTREQIREDLQLLRPLTNCVRLYGTSHGQDQVPGLAAELGLQVVLGAWIGRDAVANQAEVETALRLAQAHPGTVRMIVVGNEVLLRQEQSPQAMAQLLRQARDRSSVPIAYADVWEFWLRHAPILATEVDVVAVHILPYWEDEPVGQQQAVDHVQAIHRTVREAFEGKPVWLAETGWPAAGRQRGPAVPGPREQAVFVRTLQARLSQAGIDYNLIEAFDQPWKRQLEGAMGGAWGVLDAEGTLRDRDPLRLPMDPEAQGALTGAAWSVAGALLLLGWHRRRARATARPSAPTGAAPLPHPGLFLCAATTIGLGMGHHLAGWTIWLRTPEEWAIGILMLGLAGLVVIDALVHVARGPAAFATTADGPHTGVDPATTVWRLWRTMLLFTLAWHALTLVFDGRYRPLPAPLVAAIAVALWAERMAGRRGAAVTPAQRLLASTLMLAAPALMALEGLSNAQAWALAAAWLAVGAWVWSAPLHHGLGTRDGSRTVPSAAGELDRAASTERKPSRTDNRSAAAERSAS